ncbi:MAG: hypothetical protein AAFR95_18965, partial [Bacteroidota bacterium]
FAQAEVIDARPTRLVFGSEDSDDGVAPLRVRSRNGSIFTLDGLEVHWRVDGESLGVAVADGAANASPAQRERVRLLAIAALRDSFGALDSEQVADALQARDERFETPLTRANPNLRALGIVALLLLTSVFGRFIGNEFVYFQF